MIKPNFFIIGAPKCGTSSLNQYLRLHPNIFMSNLKEPHYFSTDLNTRIITKLDDYLSLFSEADIIKHKAIGEASASYLFSKNAIKEISIFNPDAKIIVMLRNPIELLPSYHSQLIMAGQENINNFAEAWAAEKDRKRGKKIPFFCKEPKVLYYSEWGLLGKQIEKLFKKIKPEKIKIIIFDDFKNNTQLVYEEVLNFLDVPIDNRNEFPVSNERKIIKFYNFQKILIFIADIWGKIKLRLPFNINFSIYSKLFSFNTKSNNKRALSESRKQELINYYISDVKLLSRLVNRDLSNWLK